MGIQPDREVLELLYELLSAPVTLWRLVRDAGQRFPGCTGGALEDLTEPASVLDQNELNAITTIAEAVDVLRWTYGYRTSRRVFSQIGWMASSNKQTSFYFDLWNTVQYVASVWSAYPGESEKAGFYLGTDLLARLVGTHHPLTPDRRWHRGQPLAETHCHMTAAPPFRALVDEWLVSPGRVARLYDDFVGEVRRFEGGPFRGCERQPPPARWKVHQLIFAAREAFWLLYAGSLPEPSRAGMLQRLYCKRSGPSGSVEWWSPDPAASGSRQRARARVEELARRGIKILDAAAHHGGHGGPGCGPPRGTPPGCPHFRDRLAETREAVVQLWKSPGDAAAMVPWFQYLGLSFVIAVSGIQRAICLQRLSDGFRSFGRSYSFYTRYGRQAKRAAQLGFLGGLPPLIRSLCWRPMARYVFHGLEAQARHGFVQRCEWRISLPESRGEVSGLFSAIERGLEQFRRENPQWTGELSLVVHSSRRRDHLYPRSTSLKPRKANADTRTVHVRRAVVRELGWIRALPPIGRVRISRRAKEVCEAVGTRLLADRIESRHAPAGGGRKIPPLTSFDLAGPERYMTHATYAGWARGGRAGGGIPIRTVHAGEDFVNPVSGMRRVYECARHLLHAPRGRPRIGHALALAAFPWPGDAIGRGFNTLPEEAEANCEWDVRLRGLLATCPHRPVMRCDCRERFVEAVKRRLDRVRGAFDPRTHLPLEECEWPRAPLRPDDPMRDGINHQFDHTEARRLLLRRLFVLSYVKRRGIVIETNPTSNLLILDLPSYSEHPIFLFLLLGMEVTINTDDPGPLQTTLVDEFERIAREWEPGIERAHRIVRSWLRETDLSLISGRKREGLFRDSKRSLYRSARYARCMIGFLLRRREDHEGQPLDTLLNERTERLSKSLNGELNKIVQLAHDVLSL